MKETSRSRREALLRIYRDTRTIAVVGASADPSAPAGYVPAYLQSQGYRIIPVNPKRDNLVGVPTVPSLAQIGEPIDVVDVFRPAPEGPDIARQAAEIGAKVIWFQPGTHSAEASAAATEAGLTVVTRLCMGITHGTLGLGPGPEHPAGSE
ncbi:MAG TPA: CoA-binding protein [Candidatus Limnocylindria bacterium]|nr:CoA-binding protein [Candidatus Limnocylindria bacterium]